MAVDRAAPAAVSPCGGPADDAPGVRDAPRAASAGGGFSSFPAAAAAPGDRGGRSHAARPAAPRDPREASRGLRTLLDAIRAVESGGDDHAIGDGGRSRGPYQISAAYWREGCGALGVQWDYHALVWSARHCEAVMIGYWRRWCPAAFARGDRQTLARTHNGGPRGAARPATLAYWRRVQRQIDHEDHEGRRGHEAY